MRELSLNVMDIVQNSITAGASLIEILITEVEGGEKEDGLLEIAIIDNGKGMTEEQVRNVVDPFYTTRTTRSVGLGVPLFKMEAEMTGGSFDISSVVGKGTVIKAIFKTESVDMIPLGDINSVISLLVTCNPDLDFLFRRKLIGESEKGFALDTKELKDVLGQDVPLNSPDVVLWINEYLKENTEELLGKENEK